MLDHNTVILIGGPTASGKTGLSVGLAKKINGVIINADSMQVYKELHILTARPNDDEMRGVEHHLFGHQSIATHYSVATWRAQALKAIETAHSNNQIPILVGGTGLYFKAMVEGLSPIPEISMSTREAICDLYDEIGAQAFHEKLRTIDPAMAERLPPTDRQRCIRAIEVYKDTGKTLSHWHEQPRVKPPAHLIFKGFILQPDRQMLYDRIDHRFDMMIDQGALEEVKAIHALDLDPLLPSLKAVGLPPLRAYLNGEISQEAAIEQAKLESRRYAKRQFTWFRNQMPAQTTNTLSIWHIETPCEVNALMAHLL